MVAVGILPHLGEPYHFLSTLIGGALPHRIGLEILLPDSASPNVSPGNAMIVPGSLFRCEFVIESIAQAIDD
jgi:hypothetical protein